MWARCRRSLAGCSIVTPPHVIKCQRIPVLNQPAVDIHVAEIARRQKSFITIAGVANARQGRDANCVNEGVC